MLSALLALLNVTASADDGDGLSVGPVQIGGAFRVNYIYTDWGEHYNDKGEFKMSSYWGLYRWTIILLTFAAPFLIIGGGYLLYTRT